MIPSLGQALTWVFKTEVESGSDVKGMTPARIKDIVKSSLAIARLSSKVFETEEVSFVYLLRKVVSALS
jgi:hypothetical protein